MLLFPLRTTVQDHLELPGFTKAIPVEPCTSNIAKTILLVIRRKSLFFEANGVEYYAVGDQIPQLYLTYL
jgi:hypothetical protein